MQYARDVPLTLTNDVTLTTNNVKQSPDICAVFSYTPTCCICMDGARLLSYYIWIAEHRFWGLFYKSLALANTG